MTFRIKPLDAVQFTYLPRPVDDLTEREVANLMQTSEGLICWTIDRTAIFQTRKRVAKAGPLAGLMAASRRRMWNHTAAYFGRAIQLHLPAGAIQNLALAEWFRLTRLLYAFLHVTGGLSLHNPDKTVDYHAVAQHAAAIPGFQRSPFPEIRLPL